MIALLVLSVGLLLAQEPSPPQEPAPVQVEPRFAAGEGSLEALSALERSREAKRQALREARDALAAGPDDETRLQLLERVRELQGELDRLDYQFETIATGIDVEAFDLAPPEDFDLQEELQNLFQPIVEELKSATEAPRQIERLRRELAHHESRERLAKEALRNVERLLNRLDPDDPLKLRAGLETSRDAWRERVEEIGSQRTVARFQLESRLSQRRSILESTQTALANFFRTRGLNLLLAVGAFLAVLTGLRSLRGRIARHLPRRSGDERPFYARLIDVLYFLFVGVIALLAALLVLYATGDWVLLGVVLLFLLGVAWAGKTAVPLFLEQIRLLLNLGTVREREHVLLEGIPYRVSKLSFYTLFANPELAGGVRRLPLRDLISMRSRTCSRDEVWFPCRRGDWVLLSDGCRGEVTHQSPDAVRLALPGGGHVTYRTADFLSLAPRNLSAGYRLQIPFGIDYAHQAIATTEIPAILTERLRAGIERELGADALRDLKVEFKEAGASSLDYEILLDADGSAAPHYEALQRLAQKLCVETCNEQGWTIPFAQLVLHQAPE